MWLFDGIGRYFSGKATHEYVLGSEEYDAFTARCTAETRTRPTDDLLLRNRQVETRVRTEHYVDGKYTIKKCHTRAVGVRNRTVVRDDRTVQVTGPPTRSDKVLRGFWLTFWSGAAVNGLALGAAMLLGTELVTIYRSIPAGWPSEVEQQAYVKCRTVPEVRQVSVCRDGWISNSRGSGTCSWHGGVSHEDEIKRDRDRRECVRLLLESR